MLFRSVPATSWTVPFVSDVVIIVLDVVWTVPLVFGFVLNVPNDVISIPDDPTFT